jgi:hypothetical protein
MPLQHRHHRHKLLQKSQNLKFRQQCLHEAHNFDMLSRLPRLPRQLLLGQMWVRKRLENNY